MKKKLLIIALVIAAALLIAVLVLLPQIRRIDRAEKNKEVLQTAEEETDKLVVYFSRAGLQANGMLEKGNTAVIAEVIAEQTGANLFEIIPADDHYPNDFLELQGIAKKDIRENARPAYREETQDLSKYDVIYIGAPVWYTEWPMIIYTFLEKEDLAGKTLIPFVTCHASGLSPLDRKLAEACPDNDILQGMYVLDKDAQDRETVQDQVKPWLQDIGQID